MKQTCPDTGTLRAYLDGEAPQDTGAHLEHCERCAADLRRLRTDAEAVTRALALLAPGAGSGASAGPGAPASPISAPADLDTRRRARGRSSGTRARRTRRAVAAAAAVLVGVATLGTAPGREAAASFLAQFRSERIQVVTIDPYAQSNPLAALEALGTIHTDGGAGMMLHVPGVAEAERQTGFTVRQPSPGALPEGFGPQPLQVIVHNATQVRLDLDEASVRAWLEQHGSDLEVPEGIGDTVLRVDAPAAVGLVYRGPDWEELVIGQAGLVTADAEGPVSLDELRAFLLELPGLDPRTVEQLRAIDDWRTTLPLPVPLGEFDWSDTSVAGAPAVRLRGTSGFGSAIVWQADGQVHGVGGLVSEDVARRVAEDLAR